MSKNENWPFDAWQKIAVMQLGLAPAEFWEMSLIDWFSITPPNRRCAMTKDELIKMETKYGHQ